MKKYLQILGLLIFASYCNAQIKVTGKIVDSKTKKALSYVNIGVLNTSNGTVSNENGEFVIEVKSEESILDISHLGYNSQRLNLDSENQEFQISLEPSFVMLEEINIVGNEFDKEQVLGVRNETGRGESIGFGNAQLGTELGALIRIKKETFVTSLNFVLNHAKGDSLLLRINMYDYAEGKIGEKILKHNIYVKEKQRKGTFTIDLKEYEIILNNDILVSLEWLRDFNEDGNKLITFDTKKSRKMKGTYIRSSKTTEFIKLPFKRKLKPCIYLIGKQSSK